MNVRSLIRAGAGALKQYTGTVLSVFVVQSIVAVAAMVAFTVGLALAFSQLPLWDDAVDGDFVALVACLRYASANAVACVGIACAAILLWQLASWFIVGGIYGLVAHRPEGRAETARCFGACGASTYLAYARLALWSLPNWIGVMIVFAVCTNSVAVRIAHALTIGDLIGPVAVSLGPALVLTHILWTVADYTRVELSLRPDDQHNVLGAYARSFVFVLKTPLTLLHGALGWIGFAVITVGYGYLASDHPMFGTDGAIALFVIRQGVALARTTIRFGILAGQVELGRTRAPHPGDGQTAH